MSKEDNEDARKKQESDKIRLELAIKQSLAKAEEQKQSATPQNGGTGKTLLQLSHPATAPKQPPNNDPWGAAGNSSQDLFGAPVAQPRQSLQNDPWGAGGAQAALVASTPPSQDAWGLGTTQAPSQPITQQQDLWGASSQGFTSSIPVNPTAPVISGNQHTVNDPWGSSTTIQPSYSTGVASAPVATGLDAWGTPNNTNSPISQANAFPPSTNFPATVQSNDLFGNSNAMTPTSFDPLHDFDSLRVSDNQNTGVAPLVLSSDSTTNVAFDILPLTESAPELGNNSNLTAPKTSLIDSTQGLVNLDNLMSAPGKSNPYYNNNTKSLSGGNAFNPNLTRPSMNEMRGQSKVENNPPFAPGMQPIQPVIQPTLQPNALYPAMQQPVQMPGMYAQQPQPTQVNPFFSQNSGMMMNTNQNSLF